MSDDLTPKQEEKKDLIATAKGLPPTEIFSLKPRTFDEAFRFANLIAESTLIPPEFRKNPANVLIAVQLGMELGVSPMQALQNIAVINGRPAIWGDLLPAIIYGSGLCEEFEEEGDDKLASCTVKRKGMKPITRSFSWTEAQRAGLTERQTYKSYPKRMLQMRARAYAMRDAFADVLKGVAVHEEIEDITPERDVTPIRTPQAITEKKKDESKPASNPTPVRETGTTRTDSNQEPTSTRKAKGTITSTPKAKAEQRPPQQTEKTETVQAPVLAEKTQEDWIAKCLLWIENMTLEQAVDDESWLMHSATGAVKQLKGTKNQMAVLIPFNNRKQELAKEAKQ